MSTWSLSYRQRVYLSNNRITNFIHKMAAKTSWHRYGTKLRHCHPVYKCRTFHAAFLAHPLCAKHRRGGLMFCSCFYLHFSDLCQTNYLDIYRTDLHEICRVGRWIKLSVIIFSIPQGTLPWQPILWTKSTFFPQLVVRMTFARSAPPAYNNRAIAMQITRANQLTDQLTIINRRRGDMRVGYRQALLCI